MPVHTPPHKAAGPEMAPPEQRLAMCELAAVGEQGISACSLEVRRGGASYTVDTLEEIHDAHPHDRLTLILGADMALTLSGWQRPERLLELADLAVAQRSGITSEQVMRAVQPLLRAVEPLHLASDRVRFLGMRPIDVSSSAVRERLAAGLSVAGMVPAGVRQYIADRHLYGAGAA